MEKLIMGSWTGSYFLKKKKYIYIYMFSVAIYM